MKVCAIQTGYSLRYEDADALFAALTRQMDQCDESMDLIVLPEYCDVPVATSGREEFESLVRRYNARALDKARETARRCQALVFINCACETKTGLRNTTYAIDETGEIIGKYFKAHPAPSEIRSAQAGGNELDTSYCDHFEPPCVLEHRGVRYGFMTCYDFYFYENYAPLARQNVDIIIGASHQRTDTHQALDLIGRFLTYNTGAYLVRASVSLGEHSPVGGCSMIVAPTGEMLADLKNDVGLAVAEIDPHHKYLKPAGFRGATKQHYEYIEEGRRPWLYRNGGAKVVMDDAHMPYPRVCAHRGFSVIAPENSLPAYGAAVALGAEEIEFDLYESKDGVLVSLHDNTLDRVSNGHGHVWDYTLEELKQLDFGCKHGEAFQGLEMATFEEILKQFAATTIMNIHVKGRDNIDLRALAHKIIDLLYLYDCEKHAYLMCDSDEFSMIVHEIDPAICRCVSAAGGSWDIVDRAIQMGCQKVQLFKPYFNQEMIDKAHAHGIICNVFWSDDPEEAIRFLDMGIDTILSNNYLTIAQTVKAHKEHKTPKFLTGPRRQYHNDGAKVVKDDVSMSYPRVCAHRGFSVIAPENTLPAYGAAVALGAEEIEFDLYESKDGVLVSLHDNTLDRVSDGHGYVWDYTLEELKQLNLGCKHGEAFQGLKIATFEEILKQFAATTIMNIHVKPQVNIDLHEEARKVIDLLYRYDCEKHAYLMCDDEFLKAAHEIDPTIRRCVGAGSRPWEIVDRAIQMGCQKVQLFKPYFNQEMIDKAHAHGILCNVFWSDDPEEAIRFLDMGIDTILSNNYLAVAQAVAGYHAAKEK